MSFDPGPILRFELRRLAGGRGWYIVRAGIVLVLGACLLFTQQEYLNLLGMGLRPGTSRGFATEFFTGVCAGIGLLIAFVGAPIPALSALGSAGQVHASDGALDPPHAAPDCVAVVRSERGTRLRALALHGPVPRLAFPMVGCTAGRSRRGHRGHAEHNRRERGSGLGVLALERRDAVGNVQRVRGVVRLAVRDGTSVRRRNRSGNLGVERKPAFLDLAAAARRAYIGDDLHFRGSERSGGGRPDRDCRRDVSRAVLGRDDRRLRRGSRLVTGIRHGAGRRPAWWPGPTLDGNPVLWREWLRARSSLGFQLFWLAYLLASAVLTVVGAQRYWSGDGTQPLLVGAAGYEAGIGVLAVAVQAALSWSEEKAAGREGIELILSTPLSKEAIIRGKWCAAARQLVLVAIFPLFSSVIIVRGAPVLPAPPPGSFRAVGAWTVVPIVLAQVLLYGAAFVSLGGMLSSRLARPGHSVVWSVIIYFAVTLFVPTIAEVTFAASNQNLAGGFATASPIGGPLAVLMTLFSSPYFGQAHVIIPFAVGWLVVAALTAGGLYYWTVHRFERWLGRIPAGGGRRSGSATDLDSVAVESARPAGGRR